MSCVVECNNAKVQHSPYPAVECVLLCCVQMPAMLNAMLLPPVQSDTTLLPALQFGRAAEALAACEDDDHLVLGNKVGGLLQT